MAARLWGPLTSLGAAIAVLTFLADQASKWWVLAVINLDEVLQIAVTSFFSLTMAWNEGISYSLFSTHKQGLLIALSLAITLGLWLWLVRAVQPLVAAALGLVIGGALGNALDRAVHGAVVDFLHFHYGDWSWYIFNVADIAIVAGVAVLVYDSFTFEGAKPRHGAA
jgi:signal peptidase II